MPETKRYYNQKQIIDIISQDTGCSIRDVTNILNSLCSVVKEKFSDEDRFVEMKLFPGLKITSRYVPAEQSNSNLSAYLKSSDMLLLSAEFSRRFKDSVRSLHKDSSLCNSGNHCGPAGIL